MAGASLIRAGAGLRELGPGPEREELQNSLWSMAGSVGIMLAIGLGLVSAPFTLQGIVLGGAVCLVVVGGIKSKRLAATRRCEVLGSGASAIALADRVEALEAEQERYRTVPLRIRLFGIGAKLVVVGAALSAIRIVRHPISFAVFGAAALGHIVWLVWDILSDLRRKAAWDRIDSEITALLTPETKALGAKSNRAE